MSTEIRAKRAFVAMGIGKIILAIVCGLVAGVYFGLVPLNYAFGAFIAVLTGYNVYEVTRL
jgi:hypothetical protein